jgi:hypothetical protein
MNAPPARLRKIAVAVASVYARLRSEALSMRAGGVCIGGRREKSGRSCNQCATAHRSGVAVGMPEEAVAALAPHDFETCLPQRAHDLGTGPAGKARSLAKMAIRCTVTSFPM